MTEIIKKVYKKYFEKILTGEKKFELRLANEDYKKGDILISKTSYVLLPAKVGSLFRSFWDRNKRQLQRQLSVTSMWQFTFISVLKEVDNNKNFTGREIRKKVVLTLKTKDLTYWPQSDINKYGFVVIQLE